MCQHNQRKIYYFTAILASVFIFFSWIHHLYFSDGKNTYLHSFTSEKPNATILILGDSHAYHAFSSLPESNEHIINMANPGESFKEMYLKLYIAIEKFHNLTTVVIPEDYHDFSTYRLNTNNKLYTPWFAPRKEINNVYHENYSTIEYYLVQYFPLLDASQRSNFSKVIYNKLKRKTQSNENSNSQSWEHLSKDQRLLRSENRTLRQLSHNLLEKDLIDTKHMLIQLAKNHNLRVISIAYPLSTEYRKQSQKFPIHKVISQQHEFDVDLRLDYQDFFSKQTEYWLNEDHLNEVGADIFLQYFLADAQL